MIPILYEANETEFTTLGIGPLGDAIKCVVTEELNGEYELEMTYPVSGIHYSELAEDKLIYAVPFEGGRKQIFKIYEIEKPLNGKVTVRAEHIHYLLNKMVVKPFTATSAAETMSRLKSNIIDTCPFTFSTDKTLEATFKMVVPIECGKVLGGVEGSILDVYGPGEYEFDNFDVILHTHRGNDNGITVRYGKNMTELESKVDTTSVYTGIVPYYRDSEDNITYATGYVVWSDHKSDYAYPMAKVVDMSSQFDSERESYESSHPDEIYAPTPEQLLAKANSYLTKNAGWDKNTNIKVSFVNLWQSDEYAGLAVLERVKLGDTVTIVYQKLGVSTTKKVIKTEYNVLLDRYDSIELGKPTTSLTREVANTSNTIDQAVTDSRSMMNKAIDHATKLITGGLGGHVVINTNANGNPNELLIMDTASKETAVNVWRWNLNGLGHSHNGYDGPFDDVALTADGKINASMITTGTLNANIIKAGIISDKLGYNYWNMQTGEFQLAPTHVIIGNQTFAQYAQSVQDQIDGNITSWFYNYAPTTSNAPASTWTTVNKKIAHIGDLFYDSNTGYCYRWQVKENAVDPAHPTANEFEWVQISDEDISAAMAAASQAQDTADHKRRVFTAQPTTPYDVGDLWFVGTNGDILTCMTARATGAYVAADWSKQNKYVDSSDISDAVSAYDRALDQTKVFNKLTNNGQIQGIYMDDGDLYINASYIATGILADPDRNTSWNLATGALSSKKFSIQSTNFTLTADGTLTANNAELSGSLKSTKENAYGRYNFHNEVSAGGIDFWWTRDNMTSEKASIKNTLEALGTDQRAGIELDADSFLMISSDEIRIINKTVNEDLYINIGPYSLNHALKVDIDNLQMYNGGSYYSAYTGPLTIGSQTYRIINGLICGLY